MIIPYFSQNVNSFGRNHRVRMCPAVMENRRSLLARAGGFCYDRGKQRAARKRPPDKGGIFVVLSVKRKGRGSEKALRGLMIGLAVLFLLGGILLTRGLMLPCLLMTGAYFWYSWASRREYEYTIEDGRMRIERVSDRGRTVLHDFSLADTEVLARPDDPSVAPYKKGGGKKIPKYDYTSYNENTPYYTMIVKEDGQKIKLLLDLNREAISLIRSACPGAVRC